MADPIGTEPDDRDPREKDLSRRSSTPGVSLWLVIGLIVILGVVVYAVLAIL